MTTWYDPDEIKHEALNLQRQPEWAPKEGGEVPDLAYDWDETEGEISEELTQGIARVNEIAAIVEGL